jgi:hypothetical protein
MNETVFRYGIWLRNIELAVLDNRHGVVYGWRLTIFYSKGTGMLQKKITQGLGLWTYSLPAEEIV